MALPVLLQPFRARNYRLFFGGQVVSLIGTWMTQTATLWLVYQLSGSAALLGVLAMASQVPSFLAAPLGGVLVDRLNRHRLLLLTQAASLVQSALLAVFAWMGVLDLPHLVILGIMQGCINAVDLPARQAAVVEFVEDKHLLAGAIAMNSSLFNLARLIGPAVAGFLLAGLGAAWCFTLDAVSYLAVLAGLLAMRVKPFTPRAHPRHPWVELRESLAYVRNYQPIRVLIIMVAVHSMLGMGYSVVAPVMAKDVFLGDARILGFLMSASAVGSILGGLYLGSRRRIRGLGRIIVAGGLLSTAGLAGYALSRNFTLTLVFLMITGTGGIWVIASCNTVVQTLVDDGMRGRVMSLFGMAFIGTMPFGSLLLGYLAQHWGAPVALGVCAAGTLVSSMVFLSVLPGLRAAASEKMARIEPLDVT